MRIDNTAGLPADQAADLRPVKLTLQPLPDNIPAAVRLRRLLKALLRGYRFKLVKIEDANDKGTTP